MKPMPNHLFPADRLVNRQDLRECRFRPRSLWATATNSAHNSSLHSTGGDDIWAFAQKSINEWQKNAIVLNLGRPEGRHCAEFRENSRARTYHEPYQCFSSWSSWPRQAIGFA